MNILTGAPYLNEKQLKGFDNYKYSCRDTSPYSIYVVNPLWNKMVELLPRWIAPNLMTLVGFLLVLSVTMLLSWYDYDFRNTESIPAWVWLYSALAHITGYNLDGMDGKQARRTKSSSPVGELFDHGLDSLVALCVPLSVASCMVLIGGTEDIIFCSVLLGLFGFYVSHWEKYNTGVLYLPWIYDFIHQGVSLIYLLTGIYGVGIWLELDYYLQSKGVNVSLIAIYCIGSAGGVVFSVIVSSWNVAVCYVNKECRRDTLMDGLSPFFTFSALTTAFVIWSLVSPSDILELEPRCFCSALGIAFSNITMSGVKFRVYSGLIVLAYVSVIVSLSVPQLEIAVLYTYLIVALISHMHFSYSVVRQLCTHFKIYCFRIPYEENKKNS